MEDPQQREIEIIVYVLDEYCVEAGRRIDVSLRGSDEKWDRQIIRAAKEESASLESFKEDEIHTFKTPPSLLKGIMTKQRMTALLEKLRAQLSGLPTSNADELFVELQDETFQEFFLTDEKHPCIFLLPKPHSKSLFMYKTFADDESKDIDLLVRVEDTNYLISAKRDEPVSSILDSLRNRVKGWGKVNALECVFHRFDPPVRSRVADAQTIDDAYTEQIKNTDQHLEDIIPLPPTACHISLIVCNGKCSEPCSLCTITTC